MTDYKLTDEDKDSIAYFWQAKGDLERWTGWENAKPAVAQEYPEVVKAWEDYKTSIRTMSAVVRNING